MYEAKMKLNKFLNIKNTGKRISTQEFDIIKKHFNKPLHECLAVNIRFYSSRLSIDASAAFCLATQIKYRIA